MAEMSDSQSLFKTPLRTGLAMDSPFAEDAAAATWTKAFATSTPPSLVQTPVFYSGSSPHLKENSDEGTHPPCSRKVLRLCDKKEPLVANFDKIIPQSSQNFECSRRTDAFAVSPLSKNPPFSSSPLLSYKKDREDKPGTPPQSIIACTVEAPMAPRKSIRARSTPLRKIQPRRLFLDSENVSCDDGAPTLQSTAVHIHMQGQGRLSPSMDIERDTMQRNVKQVTSIREQCKRLKLPCEGAESVCIGMEERNVYLSHTSPEKLFNGSMQPSTPQGPTKVQRAARYERRTD